MTRLLEFVKFLRLPSRTYRIRLLGVRVVTCLVDYLWDQFFDEYKTLFQIISITLDFQKHITIYRDREEEVT